MKKVSSPERIAETNQHLILNTLRLHGAMSRADLSRNLNISFPAVSSNAKRLLETNYIKEVGVRDNAVGRKPALLAFNANRGYIIGADIGRFRIGMMLTDLLGNEIARTETRNSAKRSSDGSKSVSIIYEQFLILIQKSRKRADDILCVVVGTPGILNKGEIIMAPFTEKYVEKDLRATTKQLFKADILIYNSVNLGVLGEQWKGAGVNFQNIAYISYGIGLGSAHIVDGKLFTGPNGSVGEMGFMVTDRSAVRNRFDEVGALEEALTRHKIDNYFQGGNFDEEIKSLIKNYQDGELYAKAVVDEIALNFGIALVNMCALFNPEAVIISGGLGINLGKLLIARWKAFLVSHVPFAPKLLLSELHHTETMLGAIVTGINHIHERQI